VKKIIYLLSVTLLLLQSCSSEDSSDSISSNSQLVGKWEPFQVGMYPKGTVITGNEILINYNSPCSNSKGYIQFGSEGAIKSVNYDKDCIGDVGIGTYVKTDFIINVFVNNKIDVSLEIISLNNNVLKLKEIDTSDSPEFYVVSYKKI
jgi:hypothetical protein